MAASSRPTNGSTRWSTTSGLNSANAGSSTGGSTNRSSSNALEVPGPTTGSVGWRPRDALKRDTALPVSLPKMPSGPDGADVFAELDQRGLHPLDRDAALGLEHPMTAGEAGLQDRITAETRTT